MAACAAASGAQLVPLDAQRVFRLDHLGRRVHHVRHVDPHGRIAVTLGARSRSAGVRFVKEVVTDREERKPRRAHPARDHALRYRLRERAQQGVYDPLRGFVVAGDERRRRTRVEQRPRLRQNFKRTQ